jgi:hypothetical protein
MARDAVAAAADAAPLRRRAAGRAGPAAGDPALGRPVDHTAGYLPVEVLYAVTHEGALTLDDVLTRRTHVAIEDPDAGVDAAAEVAALITPVLGWDAARQAGSVPPATGTLSNWSSLAPSARLHAEAPRAAPVRTSFATVEAPTPFWLATRPLFAYSSPARPTRCAAIAPRLTGVQRFQPAFATRSRSFGSATSAAAPLMPTAPASDPPNQVPGRGRAGCE